MEVIACAGTLIAALSPPLPSFPLSHIVLISKTKDRYLSLPMMSAVWLLEATAGGSGFK
ncbi:hypothetical protein Hanom_Chr01g00081391 [Helianthus anomalus]